jgi:hypothetical protein
MASRNKRGAKERGTMTRRFISKCVSPLALAGAILLSVPPRADATLFASASVDGAIVTACDNGIGCVPTLVDQDPAIGRLSTLATTIGAVSVSVALQTSVPGTGGLNTLSSSGTAVENTGAAPVTIQLTIGDTDFLGPAFTFTATGSGTWVDPTLPTAFGGSTITMEWFNDPANTQGAAFPGDTPGNLVAIATNAPLNPPLGTNNQSFGSQPEFNQSGPLTNPDLANFSMTLDNELVLGPGIRLESRGQSESKPLQAPVPAPATLLLLGSALALLGWRRWRSPA